jgi:hypothetical protein
MDEPLRWSGTEFGQTAKSADWYWAIGLSTISLTAASFIMGVPLFALCIAVAGGSVLYAASRPLHEHTFELGSIGLTIDGHLYTFESMNSFWIDLEHFTEPLLLISFDSWYHPQHIIPLGSQETTLVHDRLHTFVVEESQEESYIHRLLSYIGL